jgi:ABC-type lipoprotein release transport system permease subunit
MVRAELHLARRYLIGLRRRTHVATVTLISLVGLALGVLALVVTLALLEGFQASIRSELVLRATHARVSPVSGRTLDDPERLASVLQAQLPGVEMVQVVRGTSLVSSDMDAVPASVIGRSDATGAAVDRVLAARLGVGVGESIHVISPRQRLTPMGPLPVRSRVEVTRVRAPEPGSESGSVRLRRRSSSGIPRIPGVCTLASTAFWVTMRQTCGSRASKSCTGHCWLHSPSRGW